MGVFADGEAFDAVVVGTGVDACLSVLVEEKGRVLHVERASNYGGKSSGTVMQMVRVLGTDKSVRAHVDTGVPLLLSPADRVAAALIAHGQAHAEFVALAHHGLVFVSDGRPAALPVPATKEAVMLERGLSLAEKRQAMRIVGGESPSALFSASPRVRALLVFGVCRMDADPFLEGAAGQSDASGVLASAREYAAAVARHGGLIYPVGGSSAVPEALCRAAALSGRTVHMLGQSKLTVDPLPDGEYRVSGDIEGAEWSLAVPRVAHFPDSDDAHVHMHAVLESSHGLFGSADPALWTLPPAESGAQYAAHVLQLGSTTACVPRGHVLLHFWSRERAAAETLVRLLLPAGIAAELLGGVTSG